MEKQEPRPLKTAIFRLRELTKTVNSSGFAALLGLRECPNRVLSITYDAENKHLTILSAPGTRTGQSGTSLAL
jgi:hypothetical protein